MFVHSCGNQMAHTSSDCAARRAEAIGVLLDYLTASCWCPGADGLLVEDALRDYGQAASARFVPTVSEVMRRHPHLADVLLDLIG